ncbi:acyl-CoA dehydrogenase family protein [Hoyosella rhizosphaerae]|uniref:Acyl-CoA dehydrogenase n=1 Tax=Hoyosella rhizosphaerae TaxID=1755582 RepID=A0A916UCS1_9ACTN|nr:acyl-CoA dehydrogenase family protein [Hoyosella rhizosphaerae]MBN4925689.1 acyl-CoA dehydrogenase family protein [Hoyosella rhizosphaerae]GGC68678.1 acyl-CoA dehydrogenase [Hoyosella rhizosphaerae]
MTTHEVFNQVPPLVDYNPADYPALLDALALADATDGVSELQAIGAIAGSAETQQLGDLAEAHPPVLKTHDRYGNRIDEVVYDPSYHQLMRHAIGFGMHGTPWSETRPHAHLIRGAKMQIWGQADPGHLCPISMTYAVIPALRTTPELAALYEPGLTSTEYDFGLRAPLSKKGLIAGMSMTEKQGGSDVRANTTTAVRQSDGTYLITGHKWFTSAPMSDLFLTLAQTSAGVTCFLVPRVLPDGSRNPFALQRLKDKLGNRSNASSEVEYSGTVGFLVGEEGRGVRTIIEMVNMTRLDCTLATGTLMRVGVQQAVHHATHRKAFGDYLIDQPLMRNVLADLAVEAEGATLVGLWLAHLTDLTDGRSQALRRIGLAVSKYHVCKRGPVHAAEALECLGGNGYVEESRMPRLYREAPLLSIWEGSGNVAALDMLRALAKQPETLEVFFDEIAQANDPRVTAALAELKDQFGDFETMQYRARTVVGQMAQLLQASLLARYGNPAVFEAYSRSRLGREHGDVFGTLPVGIDTSTIIDRATAKAAS